MSIYEQTRRAHRIVDALKDSRILSSPDVDFLRSFLPELPKQKTLTELRHEVNDAWVGADGNEWPDDAHGVLETWLLELHEQLQGLENAAKPAKPAHPEFLEIEADYRNAPFGTIIVGKNYYPWTKIQGSWLAYGAQPRNDFEMRACRRYVLRWGDK